MNNRKLVGQFEYQGKLEEFQLNGSKHKGKRYTEYEVLHLNEYQNFLYKRAMMGLKIYSPEELSSMHEEKKKRIKKVFNRTQRVLNIYKQEVVNRLTNNIFITLFPNSPITKALTEDLCYTDPEFVNTLDLRTLGLTKRNIVDRLIESKILPKNFYELNSVTLHE